jgi:ribosomal protein S18 acetylase RimI-like enzyme
MTERTLKTRNGGQVTISPLARKDVLALQRFNDNLSEASRSLFLPHAYDVDTLIRYIERARSGKDLTYVGVVNDEIVAYFFLWEFDEPVPVLGIGIADAYQSQGLGRMLMDILIEDARAADRDGIELTTVPGNDRAFALYKKVGFRHIGDTDNVAGDGRVVREHVMFLPLEPGAEPPTRQFAPPA